MKQDSSIVFKQLIALERVLQRLKVAAFFALPKQEQKNAVYSQKELLGALKDTRSDIWQERYAKKV